MIGYWHSQFLALSILIVILENSSPEHYWRRFFGARQYVILGCAPCNNFVDKKEDFFFKKRREQMPGKALAPGLILKASFRSTYSAKHDYTDSV